MGRLLLWVGLALVLEHHSGAAHKLVCYFTNWACSRPDPTLILPQDLDPFLCTHLIFAFASLKNSQIVAKNAQDENILYPEFNKLKERNRKLKTLQSVGGWDFGTPRFTAMLSTPTRHEKFVDSVISLLRTYNFDGLNLFFLYPGLRGSPMHDWWNFVSLIEELVLAFKKEAINNLHPKLLLSAAVSGAPNIIQTSYDVRVLGRCLDFINILSYDFHGSWEKFTGHNSPLFSLPGDLRSSAYAMNYWRRLAAPSEKLIMGLPTYGHTFCLLKASETWLGARAMGPASPGKYTKQAGFMAYFEICSFVRRARKHWIEDQFVPYAYKGKKWVGYDDAASFSYKATFMKKEHFGGAMVWTLDLDDVRGTFCGNGPFLLVHILKNLLVNDGGEAMTTGSHGKYENMFTIPRDETVSPGMETMTLGKHSVTLKEKTMTPVDHSTVTPGEMTMTPVGHLTVTPGETTMSSVSHQSVTSGEMIMTPMHHLTVTAEGSTMIPLNLQIETTGEMTMTLKRKSVVPEKVIVSSGRMTITSDGQTRTLRGANLTSEVSIDCLMHDFGL
ncbi:oviduct-specific glycoprotein [Dugong dugon]